MTDLPDDLTLRTVVYKGDIDDMGVVVRDPGGERVKVSFGSGEEYVPRADLEDVTETYDLAFARGLTDTDHSDN